MTLILGSWTQIASDMNSRSETCHSVIGGFLAIIHSIMGPLSEKSMGSQQNLGAYAPGPPGKSNLGIETCSPAFEDYE